MRAVGFENGREMERFTVPISAVPDVPPAVSAMGPRRHVGARTSGARA
jgi:hypothetical protein